MKRMLFLVAAMLVVVVPMGFAALAPPSLADELTVAPAASNCVTDSTTGAPGPVLTSEDALTGRITSDLDVFAVVNDAGPPFSEGCLSNDFDRFLTGELLEMIISEETRRFGAGSSTGEPSGSYDRLLTRHAPVPGWDMKHLA